MGKLGEIPPLLILSGVVLCGCYREHSDNNVTNDELLISGFKLLHLDRNRHGDGVVLYIKRFFSLKVIFVLLLSKGVLIGSCTFCICLLHV